MPFKRKRGQKSGKGKNIGGRKFNNAVRKVISKQTETKSLGQETVEQILTSATAAFFLSTTLQPSEGASSHNRVGDTIKGIGLYYNYFITSTVAVDQLVRVIFYVAQFNLFDAVADSIFLTITDDGVAPTAEQLIDITRPVNKAHVKVLSDKIHKLNANDAGLGNRIVFKKNLLKFNHAKKYSAASGESARNNIRCLVLNRSIDNDATTVTAEMTIMTKYYYQDY